MTAIIQTNLFDYAALDAETRIVVQQRTTEIKALMKRAASDIIDIGQKLIEVKARLGHGYFGGWLEVEFTWTPQLARQFMNVAEQFSGVENETLFRFGSSALRLLAAPSTPEDVRAEAIARAGQGETITYSSARDLIEEDQESRRYDGFAKVVPPDEDDGPLSDYEEQIAAHYVDQRAQQFGVMVSSETNEWYTPAHILDLARFTLGAIDLDPASCADANRTVRAAAYYDQGSNGLAQPWEGRVWLNPPYGKTGGRSNQDIWAEKLIAEYEGGNCSAAILLVKAALGYAWFERLWYAYPTCFVRERLYFTAEDGSGDGQAKAATAILYLGLNVITFKQTFSTIGRVILPGD